MERLEQRGLLSSHAARQGRRKSRTYSLTPSGHSELRRWVRPPFPDAAISVPADLLRARMFFLGALRPAERTRFLDEAEGALHTVRARLAWLAEVRAALEQRATG